MMRWLVGTSLRFRFIVIAIAAAMVFFGVGRLRQMPVDVFPEFAPPMVEIQTPCLGLTPEEVEDLVTVPLEEALAGVDGLDVMRSRSVPQLSAVKLIFKPGTDLLHARQVVQERVDMVTPSIPAWASPPVMVPPLSATSRTMKIGLSSQEHSVIDLSMIAYWKIRQKLLDVEGVANVAIWGERLQMLQVQVDPARLKENGVTLNQVMKTTADALDSGLLPWSDGAVVGTGGFIDTPNQRLHIRHILPILSPEDLAELPIKDTGGEVLRLGDVAEVLEDHQPMIGDGIINDEVGLLLIVEKFPWANTLDVSLGVEEVLAKIKPGLPGIEIDHEIFRPATFIELSIENLTTALLIGCVLVILILGAFLWEWRVALISIVAIPLSLIAAGIVLYWQGATINTMVLAGFVIALGAVVDDAIIGIENIMRRLRQHRATGSAYSAGRIILDATIEVRSAIVYATLIEVAALIPVFFMEGLSGAFFKPLAWAYVLAIFASMVVALTVTPALGFILLRKAPLERRESPLIKPLQAGYGRVMSGLLKTPVIAYSTLGVMFLAGILIVPQLGQSLLPSFKERDFLMHWLTKPGTSWPEMNRITIQSSKELRAIPGVRNFGAHIGQALIMDEVVGIYFGENWVSVDPAVDYDETVAKIQEVVDGYPGLYRDVLTYLKERIREVLTGAHEAITVRIFGHDLHVLREQAEAVEAALKGTPGLKELHVSLQTEQPQIDVEVDLEKAQQYGLKPGDVRRAAGVIVAGLEVGDIFRGGKAYDVQIWGVPEVRNSVTDIENLLLDTPSGEQVRLADVARVEIKPTPNVVKRENMQRRIDVGGNVEEGVALSTVAEEVARRLATVEFPTGYYPVLLGEYAERQAAEGRLRVFTLLAAAIILLLLHTSFKRWTLALMAFLAFPTALVGGIIAAYMGGGIVSLGSLVGFLTVLGIAARNGIMMISHFQHLELHEGETFSIDLIMRGARERLAPILMTALTTGLALLPLVIAGDIAGHEIEYPMAVVILGGLVTSTLLNLFVIPALYLRFGKGSTRAPERIGREPAPVAG
ncbi:efflux RND transporter permease subunit [Candidatus Thiosymbion oneisti]|uniref:efflux RND transporter permease subunit n=1 Tax=Candidatus Thiosymbion oneisti TaxID=589554 RepID=UPI000B0A6333|nr:efflux RND transporter permease subunit [Candidatus Thiosymbion oneisti]